MGQSQASSLPNSMQPSIAAVALLAASAFAAPQFNGDHSLARILQEQRFNMGDGKFGAAYAQEDGVAFKEESTGNNERIGQYSYIDENGQTIVSNTLLVSMVSESLMEPIFPVEDRL